MLICFLFLSLFRGSLFFFESDYRIMHTQIRVRAKKMPREITLPRTRGRLVAIDKEEMNNGIEKLSSGTTSCAEKIRVSLLRPPVLCSSDWLSLVRAGFPVAFFHSLGLGCGERVVRQAYTVALPF